MFNHFRPPLSDFSLCPSVSLSLSLSVPRSLFLSLSLSRSLSPPFVPSLPVCASYPPHTYLSVVSSVTFKSAAEFKQHMVDYQ